MRRIILRIAIVSSGVALCAITYEALWVYSFVSGLPEQECAVRTQILSQNSLGQKIEYKQSACGGFVFSDVAELRFVSEKDPRSGDVFFSYEPGSLDPSITWDDEHNLTVRIGQVGSIIRQVRFSRGIKIKYEIGAASG
jgi:hypothetical protein